jgi:hypothetical protein
MIPERGPTSEECQATARVRLGERSYVATWYPQMGGYVGRCWLDLHACGDGENSADDGFDAIVYHDGEFPFSDGRRHPVVLHHCSADQFIEFGELVRKLTQEAPHDGATLLLADGREMPLLADGIAKS